MKFCAILFFICILFSCKNPDKPRNISTDNLKPSISVPAQEVVAPTVEEAETLIAKYYSARNREKKYPFYKGLELRIISTNRISETDSFLINANVTGRKWNNPNKDTLTIPFEEIRIIQVIKQGNFWQSDSLSPR